MNLFWLKYVSYACLAGAFYFYTVLRLKKLSLSRVAKLALYAACVVLACMAWHVQESNAERNSPRRLIIGTVAWVNVNGHKNGDIDDDFQLSLGGGELSPKLSTDDTVAPSMAQQPIHKGNTLGVLYRTWDNVPLAIDELEGQHPGWHYQRYEDGSSYIFAIGVMGFAGFLAAFFTSRGENKPEPGPTTIFGESGS